MVHFATIPITGTGINPSRSFGAFVIFNNDKVWDDHWIFWVGPFVGALDLKVAAYHHEGIPTSEDYRFYQVEVVDLSSFEEKEDKFNKQEVVDDGDKKAFKDVIESLESVCVNVIPTITHDIRDFDYPQEATETLIKRVLAFPLQKKKEREMVQASEVKKKKKNVSLIKVYNLSKWWAVLL